MSTTTAAETRAAILRNARAAEAERLRNLAIRRWGPLDETELAERVAELIREKGSAAGRKGGQTVRHGLAVARRLAETRDEMLTHAQLAIEHTNALLHLLRQLGICLHDWPGDLAEPGAACQLCGLPYLEWSERTAGGAAA